MLLTAPLVAAAAALAPTAHVLSPPAPVAATDGQRHLVYELRVDNPTRSRVRLDRLSLTGAPVRRPLATYRRRAITARFVAFGRPDRSTRALGPGRSGVLFMDVGLPRGRRAPARVRHELTFRALTRVTPQTRVRTVVTGVDVDRRPPLTLAPPLHGDRLLAVDGHARALVPARGGLRFSQRYALDLGRLNAARTATFDGDATRNESYAIYGAEVTAAGPGRAVAARDGLPDNVPVGALPSPVTLGNVAGNHVVQRLPGGRFALYAHLIPGSLRVRTGDRVRRGQLLGLVGNSGNSTEPHLHFHVADGAAILAADGRPYTFAAFRLDGHLRGLRSGSPTFERPAPPRARTRELPLDGDLLTFP